MRLHTTKPIVLGAAVAMLGSAATAQELYRSQLDSSVGWGVNASSADTAATFGYDYSADFIPEAPNSLVGDTATSGLKLEANIIDPAAAESLTAYPIGENFTGNYRLRFDMWTNFSLENKYNNASAGTTEFTGGGIGYDDTATDIGPGVQLIATNEGGSGSDWRAFDAGAFLDSSDMIAGSRNGFVPYYADFLPSVSAPAGQQAAFAGPDDTSIAGSPGFQWITMELWNIGGIVTLSVEKPGGDTLPIAVIDGTGDTDGNIGLIHADFFSSVTSEPQYHFSIIDNVVVDVPEPTTAGLLAAGGLVFLRRRRAS